MSVAAQTTAEQHSVGANMKLSGSDAVREFYPLKAKSFGIEAVAATDCDGFAETVPG